MGPSNNEVTLTLVSREIGFQIKHFNKDISVNFQVLFGIKLEQTFSSYLNLCLSKHSSPSSVSYHC